MKKALTYLLLGALAYASNVSEFRDEENKMVGSYTCINPQTNEKKFYLDIYDGAKETKLWEYKLQPAGSFQSISNKWKIGFRGLNRTHKVFTIWLPNNTGANSKYDLKKEEIYLDDKRVTSTPVICKKTKKGK